MEDRYLFKAKLLNNEEWVQGYLYGIWEKRYILWGMTNDIPNMVEVDPSTICQCTGLKDKNGNLIWENDIMVAHLDEDYPENETYIRILWCGSGLCSIENRSKDIAPIDKFDTEHFEVIDKFDTEHFEVCGNIFDSPELLESEG